MRIVIGGHSLHFIGGMERVICGLASELSARGHEVFLFTSDPEGNVPFYSIHPGVKIIHYSHGGRRRYMSAFRQQLLTCNPDVCISLATDRRHWPWYVALQGTGIPLVFSEHSAPEAVESLLWNRVERLAAMAGADGIHLLLHSYTESLPLFLRDRVRIMPNAVTLPKANDSGGRQENRNLTILSMGRLSWEKQNSVLVEAFALLVDKFPQWQLHIWGEGPERSRLAAQIRQAKLENCVFLHGATSTPQLCYANADIVCMPSSYEGFGCVAAESMVEGLPVVGFAGCPGINELIQHEVTGLLAPEMTAKSLAASLSTLMLDADLRKRMGASAREAAKAFAPAVVHDAWEQLLHDAASRKGRTRLQELEDPTALPPEMRKFAVELARCIARPNVLVGDGQYLRRMVFHFPWLRQKLHPLYSWFKSLKYALTHRRTSS